MADLPKQVDLSNAGGGLTSPEHVERDVVPGSDRRRPLRQHLQPGWMARALERALERPPEVVIAPCRRDLPGRRPDPDRDAGRRRPSGQRGPDRRRPNVIRVLGKYPIAILVCAIAVAV